MTNHRCFLVLLVLLLVTVPACSPKLYKIPVWSSGFTELSGGTVQGQSEAESSSCAVMAQLIETAVNSGRLSVWRDDGLRYRMREAEVQHLFARRLFIDTLETTDKETREQKLVVIESDFNFREVCRYEVIERKCGRERCVVVAPVRSMPYFESMEPDKIDTRPQPLFWLRYSDLQRLIANYMAAPYNSKAVQTDFAEHFPVE